MGYEIPAGLGVRLADPDREVVVMVGDGSYLMLNSEIVTAVAEGLPILVNDVQTDLRYREAVPGSNAELVVPLRRKGRVIGALNMLSENKGQFTVIDEMLLRQFGEQVAAAIENARLHEHEREYTSTLETLSEIGREFGAILQLDEMPTRIANLTRRAIDYRTFGILPANARPGELALQGAVRSGDKVSGPRPKPGWGAVARATGSASCSRKSRSRSG